MASSFEINLVNGLAGDPAVCVYFRQTGDSLLFDAGSLEALSNRELLKVRVVAISHTHIDHFIGFDRLIRVNVPHFRTVEVVGPKGITKNIEGKLAGYTWNLLDPGQVNFIVHEVKQDGSIETVRLSNSNGFSPEEINSSGESSSPNGAVKIPLSTIDYELKATYVDHGTPVLAFCLTMPDTMAVNKNELHASNLPPGSWISELQKQATQNQLGGSIEVAGKDLPTKTLAEKLLQRRLGERLIYVTDMVFSSENIKSLQTLEPSGADILVCEANYRHEHRQKAHDKFHLTTTQAALTAALVGAKKLQIFHISNSYGGEVETSLAESAIAFDMFSKLDAGMLLVEASKEFLSSR